MLVYCLLVVVNRQDIIQQNVKFHRPPIKGELNQTNPTKADTVTANSTK